MFEYIPSKPLNKLKCRILMDDILFYPVSTNCEKYILIKMSTIPPISTKRTTFHLKQLNTKKTMTHGIGNPGPSFEQAQTCVRVKPVNGIPNFPLYKQTIKNLHRLTSTQKDHHYYHKNEGQHKHGLYNSRINE